jgi:hypothetical protein
MIYFRDSIYLFTKDWVTLESTIYSLPTRPGKYTANKIGVFKSDGLITGADFDGKQLILLGYKNYKAFLWVFNSFSGIQADAKVGKRIALSSFGGAQTEGIAIKDRNTIFISNEKSIMQQRLWQVKLTE